MSILDVRQAELKTVTIEIRSLVVNGKQVTLSVFRQLLLEDWLAENGKPRGVVWGRVNYYWGKCSDTHLHIVWQLDTELRRACLPEYPDWERVRDERAWQAEVIEAWGLAMCLEATPVWDDDRERWTWPTGQFWKPRAHTYRKYVGAPPSTVLDRAGVTRAVSALPEELRQSPADLLSLYTELVRACNAWMAAYRLAYAEALASPQLFIAV